MIPLIRERVRANKTVLAKILTTGCDVSLRAVLKTSITSARATRTRVEVMGDWYAAGGIAWRTDVPISARSYAREVGLLEEHLQRAEEWDRAGRPAIRAKVAGPVRSSEDFAREASTGDTGKTLAMAFVNNGGILKTG